MAKKYSRLVRIENDREITNGSDCAFLHHLKTGLLLALKEQGILTDQQLWQAEENLRQKRGGPP
ncbi:MAG: hypothetical protein IJ411_04160, partial [Oscillospiraceae bacterium]|nr:hypothetical protein [Oscillospiraceae bacterium]